MSLQQLQIGTSLGGVIVRVMIIVLIAFRKKLGALNAASWLVMIDALVLVGEHAQFAISYSVPRGQRHQWYICLEAYRLANTHLVYLSPSCEDM